eukprot:TRINITY_DN535_c0_g1_i13.p1 TRINITY_DN535_c0_g1~~TRINITY_DN535_c0_g1_i13.p1  ORF type:complete len:127 (-),score=16.35 TRINITY_DN535_c0_g1_i13:247-627(-)
MTPPAPMVTSESNLFNSSSFLIASMMWKQWYQRRVRGVKLGSYRSMRAVLDSSHDFSVSHPLEDAWTWWYDNPQTKPTFESWQGYLKEIYSFDTVEDFWSLWNNIKGAHELAPGSRKWLSVTFLDL